MQTTQFRFPKYLRVTKSTEYKRLSQKGKRLFGTCFVADYLQGPSRPTGLVKGPKVGITVSKKYGKAHERNRFKRLVREAFRLNRHLLPTSLSINIRPSNRVKGVITLEEVVLDLKRLFVVTNVASVSKTPE